MADFNFTKVQNKIFELGLGPIEIAIFCAIKSHGGQSRNSIFPSHQRLARMVGCSVNSVKRALKKLREHRILSWEAGAPGRSATYFLNEIGLWIGQNMGPYRPDMGPHRPDVSGPTELPPRPYRPTPLGPTELPIGPHRATNQICINQIKINQIKEPGILDEEFEGGEEDRQRVRELIQGITRRMHTPRELD